jgi:hypothetical protein
MSAAIAIAASTGVPDNAAAAPPAHGPTTGPAPQADLSAVDPRIAKAADQAQRRLRGAYAVGPSIRSRRGLATSIVAKPGHPLRIRTGAQAVESPVSAARSFLGEYGGAFGLTGGAANLATRTVRTTNTGDSVVQLQQHVGGVPVLGGDLAVATDARGGILSASGEIAPSRGTVAGTPRISSQAATRTAIEFTRRQAHVAPGRGSFAAEAESWMFDPQLIGAPGIPGLRRVWRVDVTGHDLPTPTPASPNAQSGPKAAPKATTPNA